MAGDIAIVSDPDEFKKRMQSHKEVIREWDSLDGAVLPGLSFDETGSLISYSSPLGVKTASVGTGELLKILGKNEQQDHYLKVVTF